MIASAALLVGQIGLRPVYGWWVTLFVVGFLIASLWLTLTTKGLTAGQKIKLTMIRGLALLFLILAWLRPGFISKEERESAGAIAVLMDRSQSMTFPSHQSGRSRWDVQKQVYESIEEQSNLEIGKSKLIPYWFDRQLGMIDQDAARDPDALFRTEPDGRITDLGQVLTDIGQAQLDPPLRGVILLTDGTQTAIPADIDPAVAASQMSRLDQPLVVVGLGSRGDEGLVKDVAIRSLPETFNAYLKKELQIPLVVDLRGVQNLPVKVQLTLQRGAEKQVVASREIRASRPSESMPIQFKLEMAEEGDYLLLAEATVDSREQITTNNLAMSFITVREGGVRILYLEGEPRFEQKFLKQSLNESIDFDADYVWFPERLRRRWPIDISRQVDLSSYDAFVIGDLDSRAFEGETADQIMRYVARGAGLLATGGYHSFDAGGYGQSALRRALPVQMTQPRQRWEQPIDRNLHVEGEVNLSPSLPHPVTSFADEPENTRIWQELPPLQGMNRFGRLSTAPGTQVLLESQDRDPVMVAGTYQRGRIVAFAGDTTYRWVRKGFRERHQQFWRQVLLWLVRRDSLSEGFLLKMTNRRVQIDDTPKLTLEWFGGSKNKEMPKDVELTLTRDGKRVSRLNAQSVDDRTQEARILGLSEQGLYQVSLEAESKDGEAYQSDIAFMVLDESRESARPQADWQMMANMVAANATAGGKLVLPEDVGEALRLFRDRQDATKISIVERRQLGDEAWDSWCFLVIFCLLMTGEWTLRKLWQLP